LAKQAASLAVSLASFRERLHAERPDAASSVDDVSRLLISLSKDFDLDLVDHRGRKRCLLTEEADLAKLRRRVRDERRQSEQARAELAEAVGIKVSGRLRSMWLLRVGLSNPLISGRMLSDLCRDFTMEEAQQIGKDRTASVRDAFCEVLKHLNRKNLEDLVQEQDGPLFATHVHDEAALRVRSFSSELGKQFCRARYSKVLEHVVTARSGTQSVEMLCELQALASENACTIATGIVNVIEKVLCCAVRGAHRNTPPRAIRIIHIQTGDAVSTNESAARRVLRIMREMAAQRGVHYFMVLIKCASHQSNLVVMTAVCGGKVKRPAESCPITGACVRFFK
jgi:hypothetical protein